MWNTTPVINLDSIKRDDFVYSNVLFHLQKTYCWILNQTMAQKMCQLKLIAGAGILSVCDVFQKLSSEKDPKESISLLFESSERHIW